MGDGVSRHFRVAGAAGLAEALWDIKGKRYQASVWDLQGGRVRDKVRAMVLLNGSGRDELAASAQQAKRDGFTAVKLTPFPWRLASGTTPSGSLASTSKRREFTSCDPM